MNELMQAVWKAYQIKRLRDRIQRLSNKRDKDRELILAEKRRLLALEQGIVAPPAGASVQPSGFKANEL